MELVRVLFGQSTRTAPASRAKQPPKGILRLSPNLLKALLTFLDAHSYASVCRTSRAFRQLAAEQAQGSSPLRLFFEIYPDAMRERITQAVSWDTAAFLLERSTFRRNVARPTHVPVAATHSIEGTCSERFAANSALVAINRHRHYTQGDTVEFLKARTLTSVRRSQYDYINDLQFLGSSLAVAGVELTIEDLTTSKTHTSPQWTQEDIQSINTDTEGNRVVCSYSGDARAFSTAVGCLIDVRANSPGIEWGTEFHNYQDGPVKLDGNRIVNLTDDRCIRVYDLRNSMKTLETLDLGRGVRGHDFSVRGSRLVAVTKPWVCSDPRPAFWPHDPKRVPDWHQIYATLTVFDLALPLPSGEERSPLFSVILPENSAILDENLNAISHSLCDDVLWVGLSKGRLEAYRWSNMERINAWSDAGGTGSNSIVACGRQIYSFDGSIETPAKRLRRLDFS